MTESCLLTDPGALLSASDEPRGNVIKIVIGLVILARARVLGSPPPRSAGRALGRGRLGR